MAKHLIFTSIILLLVSSCKSTKQTTSNQTKPDVLLDKPLTNNNSLLWQVSGNGLNKPSYLFGTIHIISQDDYFLGKNVVRKIQKSDELIMEIDLDKMDVLFLAKLSVLPDGKSIKDFMHDSDYTILQSFMEDSIGIKKFTFENAYGKLKPFFLEQLIFIKYLGQETESYEQNFKKLAEDKNIPMSGLETYEEQLKFIDDIPLEDQLTSIVSTIKNYSAETQKLSQLVKDYKAQNLTALTASFEADEDQTLKTKLVDKRNSNWIPKLKSIMQDKSCFVAVGAGHLGGENGLINLLKKQGYSVEPISIN
jgi:hypothetical protein